MKAADVIVLGGGIAGVVTAHRLARKGCSVIVFDREDRPGMCASGNRDALVTPCVGDDTENVQHVFYNHAFPYAVKTLSEIDDDSGDIFLKTGVLQLASTKRLQRLIRSRVEVSRATVVSDKEASDISGVQINQSSYFMHEAGKVCPRRLIDRLLSEFEDRIEVHCNCEISGIDREEATWLLRIGQGLHVSAPNIVICAAHQSKLWELTSELFLVPVRGETLLVKESEHSKSLRVPVVFDGYVAPSINGLHFVGSHYRHDDMNVEADPAAHQHIISRLCKWVPSMKMSSSLVHSSRVCFRTSTSDRLPLVGKLQSWKTNVPFEGVYVNCGHGSRGFVSCFASGEIIARHVFEQTMGELTDIANLIAPYPARAFNKTTNRT